VAAGIVEADAVEELELQLTELLEAADDREGEAT